ncbi:MAG: MBL fold metallo-hydrolase [Synergistaceae bacterium]|nr:MBL fold metallo-hydrolase [Synergistaceae bacterium]
MFLLFAGILVLAFFLSAAECGADVPAQNTFKVRIGAFEVFLLSEGQSEGNASILIGADPSDVKKFIASGYPSAVNAFAVRTPDGVLLFDAGFGRELFKNLRSVGIGPDDIASLFITHSHGDHIGGLVKDAAPSFPNAKVYIAASEFEWSQAVRDALAGYAEVERITPGSLGDGGAEVLSGVRAIEAYGHTPGHTIFLVESGDERLLIWGDLTHAMAIQMPRPDVSVTYDFDPIKAAQTRQSVLKFACDEKLLVAGMHIAYPSIGVLEKDDENPGGYKFVPLPE